MEPAGGRQADRAGDCTVRSGWVMHGSGGNETDGYRRACVIAYRSLTTVEIESETGSGRRSSARPPTTARSARQHPYQRREFTVGDRLVRGTLPFEYARAGRVPPQPPGWPERGA